MGDPEPGLPETAVCLSLPGVRKSLGLRKTLLQDVTLSEGAEGNHHMLGDLALIQGSVGACSAPPQSLLPGVTHRMGRLPFQRRTSM